MNTKMENGTQMTLEEWMPEIFQKPIAGASDFPVRTSPLPEKESDSTENDHLFSSKLCDCLTKGKRLDLAAQDTFSLRTLKTCLVSTGGGDFAKVLFALDERGYDAEWQVLNSKNFNVPQNRERVFVVGHLRGRSTAEVFPVEGADGADCFCGVAGHREGFRRNLQVFDRGGITEALSTCQGGGREHHTFEIIGKAYDRDNYGDNRNRVLGEGGCCPSLTATQYKEPYRIGLSLSEIQTRQAKG